MDLDHSFTVHATADEVWRALTDVPRVARCMPGASLDEESSDPYTGTVKVKVGAVAVKFRGELRFAELDESAHRLQLDCRGKDVRGASGASAMISMVLVDAASGSTEVRVTTNLQLSGKIAQFGRGMLQDVSNAILQRFVSNLERDLRGEASGDAAPTADPGSATSGAHTAASTGAPSDSSTSPLAGAVPPAPVGSRSPGPGPTAGHDDDDMIDLGATVLPVMLKRYGSTALSGLAVLLGLWALIRTFGRPRAARAPYPDFEPSAPRPPLVVIHRWPTEKDR